MDQKDQNVTYSLLDFIITVTTTQAAESGKSITLGPNDFIKLEVPETKGELSNSEAFRLVEEFCKRSVTLFITNNGRNSVPTEKQIEESIRSYLSLHFDDFVSSDKAGEYLFMIKPAGEQDEKGRTLKLDIGPGYRVESKEPKMIYYSTPKGRPANQTAEFRVLTFDEVDYSPTRTINYLYEPTPPITTVRLDETVSKAHTLRPDEKLKALQENKLKQKKPSSLLSGLIKSKSK